MKCGVILYHSNINALYKKRWIDACLDSILAQTYNDFEFYEINYGDDGYSILTNINSHKKYFWNIKMLNYADAMNFILDKAFENCDFVFNINLDDCYQNNRFDVQLKYLKDGYDIVSSDFVYIEEVNNDKDDIIFHMNIKNNIKNHDDIGINLNKKHNVIAHPCVAYSKKFWLNSNNRYDINKVPAEDLDLWIKAFNNNYKFYICDEILLYYRIHTKQSSNI
jgi:hypothetical protein